MYRIATVRLHRHKRTKKTNDRLGRLPLLFFAADRRRVVAALVAVVTELSVVPALDRDPDGVRRQNKLGRPNLAGLGNAVERSIDR